MLSAPGICMSKDSGLNTHRQKFITLEYLSNCLVTHSLRSISLVMLRYFKNNLVLDQVKTQKLLCDKQDKTSIEKSVEIYN